MANDYMKMVQRSEGFFRRGQMGNWDVYMILERCDWVEGKLRGELGPDTRT